MCAGTVDAVGGGGGGGRDSSDGRGGEPGEWRRKNCSTPLKFTSFKLLEESK